MGASLSSNLSQEAANIMINDSINATQNCQTTVSANEVASLRQIRDSIISIDGTDFSDAVSVNTSCLMSAEAQTNITNTLDQTASQISNSISEALSLSVADSNNVASIVDNLAENIADSFQQNCVQDVFANENFSLRNIADSTVNVTNINFSDSVTAFVNCVSMSDAVMTQINNLQQATQQKATSKTESLLAPLFAIVLIIVIIIGALILGGGKALTNPKLWITIAVIVVVYLILAGIFKFWPFKEQRNDGSGNKSTTPANGTNGTNGGTSM
jgi:hypothetical protein